MARAFRKRPAPRVFREGPLDMEWFLHNWLALLAAIFAFGFVVFVLHESGHTSSLPARWASRVHGNSRWASRTLPLLASPVGRHRILHPGPCR